MQAWPYTVHLVLVFISVSLISSVSSNQPNFILILTDDQDVTLNGLYPMEHVNRIFADGATFNNAFTTTPICCPSRASLLTGLYAHNTQTINNSESGGCYGDYWRTKLEPNALPVLLQQAGYDTFYGGKYLNQYRGSEVPPGWTDFYGLHGNSVYYNYVMRENGRNISYRYTYLTDLIRNKLLDFLEQHSKNDRPFFAMVAPPAPHAPFEPADRHRDAFAGVQALRTPNFNVHGDTKNKHWLVAATNLMTSDTIGIIDDYYRLRWETLLAVDEMVADIFYHLKRNKYLRSTYIIYTSDNGFHLGQFAQPFDKRQPYETDIRVPLLIRGPTIKKGMEINAPVALIDLLPTILEWARLPPADVDGESFVRYLSTKCNNNNNNEFERKLLIQYWGEGTESTYNPLCPYKPSDRLAHCTLAVGCACQDAWNNTYACVRHLTTSINTLYCEFKDDHNFVEFYNIAADPYEIKNIVFEMCLNDLNTYKTTIANLTQCTGSSCTTYS